MSGIYDFLDECKVFYLATCDGDQPKVRPLGAFQEIDGQVYFAVGTFKDVYKQMQANPKAEVVACKPNGTWLRYTGDVVFDGEDVAAKFLEAMPDLAKTYEENGWIMGPFHLENATAVSIDVMGPGTELD